jgi:hypothetical protein
MSDCSRNLRPLRYPDFICIGAQKAGTTWLHKMLGQHPDIWLPPVKEVHYFNRVHLAKPVNPVSGPSALDAARAEVVRRTIQWTLNSQLAVAEKNDKILCLNVIGEARLTDEWYGNIFSMAPATSRCGEITPEYALLQDDGIEHIFRLRPEIKIIFILRDPIDRGWSHLRMDEQKGLLTPKTMLRRISRSAGFLAYSDYTATIERFQSHVLGKNFLLLYFDDIVERPQEVLRKTCEFLDLDYARARFKNAAEPVHSGQTQEIQSELYTKFQERMAPIYLRLLLLDNPVVNRWYAKHYENPKIS